MSIADDDRDQPGPGGPAPSAAPPAPGSGSGPTGASAPAPRRDHRRHESGSTPARLRTKSIGIIVVALVLGLLTAVVVNGRRSVTSKILQSDGQVIVSAGQFKVNMARADAVAANAFLTGGIEDADQRQRYETALADGSKVLEDAARRTGNDEAAHTLLQSMLAQVSVYSGLVETARANNRQGFPVGAAYLNRASALLSDELFPAADQLASRSLDRYESHYNSQFGLSIVLMVVLVGGAIVLVVLLVRSQLFIRRRFRRSVNLPLAGATLVAIVLSGWLVVGWGSQSGNLRSAHQDGYEGVQRYLDARAAAFKAKGDESLYLIAWGSGGGFEDDFKVQAEHLVGPDGGGGLLADAADSASSSSEQAQGDEAVTTWQTYAEVHDQVVQADAAGDRSGAVSLALGGANVAFNAFDDASRGAVSDNQVEFLSGVQSARDGLRGLAIGGLVLAIIVAILAAWGIQLRVNEYR